MLLHLHNQSSFCLFSSQSKEHQRLDWSRHKPICALNIDTRQRVHNLSQTETRESNLRLAKLVQKFVAIYQRDIENATARACGLQFWKGKSTTKTDQLAYFVLELRPEDDLSSAKSAFLIKEIRVMPIKEFIRLAPAAGLSIDTFNTYMAAEKTRSDALGCLTCTPIVVALPPFSVMHTLKMSRQIIEYNKELWKATPDGTEPTSPIDFVELLKALVLEGKGSFKRTNE